MKATRWSLGALMVIGAGCVREPRDASDTATTGETAAVADTSRAAFAECNPTEAVSEASRARVVTWARGLRYHPPDSSRGYIGGLDSSQRTRIRVEAVGDARLRPRAVLRRGCVIGRIISLDADPTLGLAADTNYIWADSLGGRWRVLVLPDTSTTRPTSFPMSIHEHRRAGAALLDDVRRPCVDCEMYGWCRWPLDTARAAILRDPGGRIPGVRGDTPLRRP